MPYLIEIEHEWNKNKKGYMAHSDAIGEYFTDNKQDALFIDTLLDVGETLEFMDENYYIIIDDGKYLVTSVIEVELVEKQKIKIEDL